MFRKDDIVEKDLERIRRANLPKDRLSELEAQEAEDRRKFEDNKPEPLDILAMIIAAFSIIGPYALAFIAIFVVFGMVFGN